MNAILTIFKLLPAIIAAMKTLEEIIPGTGKGEEKLAALRAMLEAIDTDVAKVWPQIAPVVAILCGKLFKK